MFEILGIQMNCIFCNEKIIFQLINIFQTCQSCENHTIEPSTKVIIYNSYSDIFYYIFNFNNEKYEVDIGPSFVRIYTLNTGKCVYKRDSCSIKLFAPDNILQTLPTILNFL